MILRYRGLVENWEIYVVGLRTRVLSWNYDILLVPLFCLLCSLHIMCLLDEMLWS